MRYLRLSGGVDYDQTPASTGLAADSVASDRDEHLRKNLSGSTGE